jgi:hypothetical protein
MSEISRIGSGLNLIDRRIYGHLCPEQQQNKTFVYITVDMGNRKAHRSNNNRNLDHVQCRLTGLYCTFDIDKTGQTECRSCCEIEQSLFSC